MSKINWTSVLVFGGIVLLVPLVGLSLLPMFFSSSYWGMGSGTMWRGGMMGGWYPWCGGTGRFGGSGLMGGLFTLLGLLIPLGLLGLMIVGGVWLVRNMGRATVPSAPAQSCPGCSRPTEPEWKNCPYCGEEL